MCSLNSSTALVSIRSIFVRRFSISSTTSDSCLSDLLFRCDLFLYFTDPGFDAFQIVFEFAQFVLFELIRLLCRSSTRLFSASSSSSTSASMRSIASVAASRFPAGFRWCPRCVRSRCRAQSAAVRFAPVRAVSPRSPVSPPETRRSLHPVHSPYSVWSG